MQKSQSSIPQSIESLRYSLNFPSFWHLDPQIWFEQVEAFFQMVGITDDSQKYFLLLANANHKLLVYTADIVRNPSMRGNYFALKERILQVFSKPLNRQLEDLLEMHKTEKPSKIIKAMKFFAAGRCDSVELTKIFLAKCMPEMQQSIAMGTDGNLQQIEINADKVCETKGIFEQDQNFNKYYSLNQIRDLLRSMRDQLA